MAHYIASSALCACLLHAILLTILSQGVDSVRGSAGFISTLGDARVGKGHHHHRTPHPTVSPTDPATPEPEPTQPAPEPSPRPVPVYASTYEVSLTYSLPYVSEVQPTPLDMPIKAWTDASSTRQRIEYYDGMDVYLWQYDMQKVYQVSPHQDHVVCDEFSADGPTVSTSLEPLAPTSRSATLLGSASHIAMTPAVGAAFRTHRRAAIRALHQHGDPWAAEAASLEDADESPLIPLLPDVSGWDYQGLDTVDGESAHVWYLEDPELDKVNHYWFYASADRTTADGQPQPLVLRMMGANFEFGSHYDEYLFTYHSYRPDVDPAALEAPEACADARRAASVPRGALAVASQLHRPTPRPQRHRGASEAYDAFALAHGRRHSSRVEYLLRAAVFESVSAFVSSHNAASRSFSVAINRWADCTEEEFRRLVLLPRTASGIAAPPSGAASRGPAARALAGASAHRRLEGMIPGGVDWRGTGAITPVKDQASCGSCWSFAASGAIEGALFVGTGQSTSVSEQNLVDCSWDFEHAYGPYSSEGCDGGFFAMAMAYVKDKGIAPEADYPYIGQNGFCRRSPAGSPDVEPVNGPTFTITDFVVGPNFDAQSLKEALYSAGPVAVSIQADVPTFRFYASGVYDDADCHDGFDYLDHAVLATGYGVTDSDEPAPGIKYFVIKNSWSPYWGDDGYIKIAEEGNICGVATDWAYAVVSQTPGTE